MPSLKKPMLNTAKCKSCNKEKIKLKSGRYFVDNLGCTWSGKICPECKRNQQKIHAAEKRLVNRKTCETCSTIVRRNRSVCYKCEKKPVVKKDRCCRDCGKKLSTQRYFHCSDCVPSYETDHVYDRVMSLQKVYENKPNSWRSEFIEEVYEKLA
jgi:hypothetical protein